MHIDENSALENLTSLTLAIGEDKKLRSWFDELASKPPAQRTREILAMSERMANEGRDAGLAATVRLLADERIFAAAQAALAESQSS